MNINTERFLVDEAGDKVAVLIDIAEYIGLLEDLEELESIRAYDAAKADPQAEVIPFVPDLASGSLLSRITSGQ